ncbi:MAG: GntR family transcriptional regulator [Alicyclobacillus sp.]|nr:GntR family transcriptional regulator [Alicyclobacillus sp.]
MSMSRERSASNGPPKPSPSGGQTKTDVAVSEIRKRILMGVYPAGSRLRQNHLVQDLGLGVTPVREALMQLVSEGLLLRRPYAGVVVSNVSRTSVVESYAVRKLLERHAVELACGKLTVQQFDRLAEDTERMEQAHAADDERRFHDANYEFHMGLYDAAGNAHLRELIEVEWRSFPRGTFGLSSERRERSILEHRSILRALQDGDAAAAGAWMVVHISSYEQHVLGLMPPSVSSTGEH